jgi:serine/threonine protein kinase
MFHTHLPQIGDRLALAFVPSCSILDKMTPNIPNKFGPYEIKGELGRGGMATVYRAYDPRFDREVALKVLPREFLHDPQFRVRFEREIKTIAKLEHPAIVPVYDVGEEDGQPYYVMRYMSGGSLSEWIKKGAFSVQDTARIIERLAAALAYAHQKKIIHRDLKPGNVLFDQNGDPYITDFGIAKFTEAATNVTGSAIIGTPAYMSPEQAQSEQVDGRSDIYGMGVIIYEMLTGRQPYKADTPMGVVIKHITDPVPEISDTNPKLPAGVSDIIKTAMAKDKKERYPTMTDLASAVSSVVNGNGGVSTATGTGTKTPRMAPSGSSRKKLWFVAVPLILLAGLAGVFSFRSFRPSSLLLDTVIPTRTEEATRLPSPTNEVLAVVAPTEPQFAPVCQDAPASCDAPSADVRDKFCVNKIPYTLLALPEGSTFEVVTSGFKCSDEGVRDNSQMVSCTGQELVSFDLKVCNSACNATDTVSAGGQCPDGYGYDSAGQCCAAVLAPDSGCTVIKVDLRDCS